MAGKKKMPEREYENIRAMVVRLVNGGCGPRPVARLLDLSVGQVAGIMSRHRAKVQLRKQENRDFKRAS